MAAEMPEPSDINIVRKVKRSDIVDGAPASAQYGLLAPTGKIQKFYKFVDIKYNTGEQQSVLHYESECGGGWLRSSLEKTKIQKLEFVELID